MPKQIDKIIRNYRKKLRNQYALVNSDGDYEAVINGKRIIVASGEEELNKNTFTPKYFVPIRKKFYSHNEIEAIIENLQNTIWNEKINVWNEDIPNDPIESIDPLKALDFLGFDYSLEESLGSFTEKGMEMETAGIIDGQSKIVLISRKFSPAVRNFTAAHELGHALLHQGMSLHRDRAMDGSAPVLDPMEHQANKAATYYLMPRVLVISAFMYKFGTKLFTKEMIPLLGLFSSIDNKNINIINELDIAKMLSKTTSFGGDSTPSLATQFKVSNHAMALRLLELGLIDLK